MSLTDYSLLRFARNEDLVLSAVRRRIARCSRLRDSVERVSSSSDLSREEIGVSVRNADGRVFEFSFWLSDFESADDPARAFLETIDSAVEYLDARWYPVRWRFRIGTRSRLQVHPDDFHRVPPVGPGEPAYLRPYNVFRYPRPRP
jgi:hypothetical protein